MRYTGQSLAPWALSQRGSILRPEDGEAEQAPVLIVDDEPQVRNALRRLVDGIGLVSVIAASAEEAYALAEHQSFGVVVTDLRMPGMGGISLLQRLSPLQKEARFLIITGAGEVTSQVLPRGHGIQVFQKPWVSEELIRAILGGLMGSREQRVSCLPPPLTPAAMERRLLLVEDKPADVAAFKAALSCSPGRYQITVVRDTETARKVLAAEAFELICMDLSLPDASGLAGMATIQSYAPEAALVVLTAFDDENLALDAVRFGAQDYMVKGTVSGATIHRALRYARERKKAEARLADLAFHDQLTGLANRTLFRQRLAQAISDSSQGGSATFAVLMIDLDRFKSINDGLGHDAGDAFLHQVAERLRRVAHKSDTVARLGGDEFAFLLREVDPLGGLEGRIDEVLLELRRPASLCGTHLRPTASVGASVYPQGGKSCDELLATADAAMYAAKEKGRNRFQVFGEELRTNAAQRLLLEDKLRRAIEDQELELYFQPQVGTGKDWQAVEALMRWPKGGHDSSAGAFIPVLEDSGLICEMGVWIFDSVCRQLRDWREAGLRVARVAVNVSPRQFATGVVVEPLRDAVRRYGLRPSDVEVELTESTLVQDTQLVADALGELSSLGFRLALDDFGTGYSSLAFLDQFPINTVKIDRSFVRELDTLSRRRELVGGIIQLSHRMGLDVVAEGVEGPEQLAVLLREGCDIFQGYYFGKAISGVDYQEGYPELLKRCRIGGVHSRRPR